uniref:Clp R domain-containing protein n=1 Tax=Chlamydomonas leiostraca TaxID=1034604 RepID=A0A7S0WMJ2_9CHLO|mmetsp:Transcript_19184/g.48769  ORF Transcript_19184/g.48769 Transcript_19184/m.48769 type:complete len:905 (+) Transcript_19184:23-2737(+)
MQTSLIPQRASALLTGRVGQCPPRAIRRAMRNTSKVTCLLVHQRVPSGPSTSSARQLQVTRYSRRTVKVSAVFEKFTERSIKSVMIAQQEAKLLGAAEVSTEHILLGLISEETNSKNGYLNSGLSLERAKAQVEAFSGGKKRPVPTGESIPFSRDVRRTFEAATNECKKAGVNFISPEHILLAMLNMHDSTGRRIFESLSVDCDGLKAEAQKRLKGDAEAEQPKKKRSAEKEGPKMMDEYCKDLCAEVRAGHIDPVIGREREVARVTQILARRTKNNPILLGEPGVGKTAIAEGLAHAIVNRRNPDGSPLPTFLHNKRILQLDVGLIIAGAKERGELENRVTKMISEIREAGNVVLMIDEVHTLVGAGSVGRGGGGGGGLDISNLIKPALARGEFQVMGATTIDEHRKYIERDAALERRFQPVYVDEPTEAQTLEILKGLRERYERHHHVVYSPDALDAAVRLSHKYIADRHLPDKAIDLLDEAGSRVRIQAYSVRKSLNVTESPKVQEYLQVMDTKDEALKDALYEEAVILRKRENDYRVELSGPADKGASLPLVDVGDIEAVVAAWTGIPVERMGEDEKDKLRRLSSVLKERLIGQDEPVEAVAAALMRARCGLKDPNRPVASLLLVGPTGVGKTELAKVLAEQYFGSRDAMIRLDMSEYMEKHAVSRLIGAPPGYVGYDEGGQLTEAVRRRPYSVILFDEVEKAHADVFNVLLQVLDDGRVTDSQGRVVSFKNAIIIMTSNLGSAAIFEADGDKGEMKSMVMNAVRGHFRPEFINRIDEFIIFDPLGQEQIKSIVRLQAKRVGERLAEKKMRLELADSGVDYLARVGYDPVYGARPVKRAVQRELETTLAKALLRGDFGEDDTVVVEADDHGLILRKGPKVGANGTGAAAPAVAAGRSGQR